MSDESTSTALAPTTGGGEISTPPPSSPAVIPQPPPLAPERSAVTADKLGSLLDRPARTSGYQPIVAPENDPEPDKLTPDKRNVSDAWMSWMIRNLPAAKEARAAEEAVELSPEFSNLGYSSNDEIRTVLADVNAFYNSPSGIVDMLDKIHENDYPTFERTFHTLIGMYPEAAIAQLQGQGHLPQFEEPQIREIPRDVLVDIPKELWGVAEQVSPNLLKYWKEQGSLESNLAQKAQIDS